MWRNLRSLRLRLVVAFILVSVPPMLLATYIGARLISDAFETNVEQWLEETSQFFVAGIRDSTEDAERAAKVIAARVQKLTIDDEQGLDEIKQDMELLQSVGYDLIAIYDEAGVTLHSTSLFEATTKLPIVASRGLFELRIDNEEAVIVGSVLPLPYGDKAYFLFVGTKLDERYLSSTKVVTSLEVRLFRQSQGQYKPVITKNTSVEPAKTMPSANVISRLSAGDQIVFDQTATESTYRAVYAALRGTSNQLVGILFIGLESSESFYEQISQWQLFGGIFLFGSLLSVVAGLWMSGLLVRPLKALTKGVRSITSGDYQSRVSEEGSREIKELASGFNGMAAQLSKLHGLEEELRRRDRMTALGEAAMVIAHEVRNPLGIIKTSAEVVRKRAQLGASEERLLGYVIDEVRRIERLIRDFLDFARPKAPVKSPVKLGMLVERVAVLTRLESQKHNVTLDIVGATSDIECLGDIDQLHQALLNLVLNALDAMPDSGTLRIAVDGTETQARIVISDTGVGIASDIVDKIFDPFFTTKAKGTGLGLAKVQHVAEAHGGTVTCSSSVGSGAVFTMTLPRTRSETHALQQLETV